MFKYKYNFNDIFAFLICMIPPTMILGAAIPDFIISITALSFIVITFVNRQFAYYKDNIFRVAILLWIYLLFSVFLNQSLSETFNLNYLIDYNLRTIFFFRFVFFYLAFTYFFQKSSLSINFFFKVIFITFIFVSSDTLFQYFNGKDIFGFVPMERDIITNTRLSGPFKDELIPGSYLNRFLFIFLCAIFFIFKSNKYTQWIILIMIVFSITTIFLTGERAAFILSVFGLTILIFINNKLRKILSYSTILLFIFVVISLAFNPVLKKRMLDYTFFQMGLSDKWAGEDKSYLALLGKNKSKFIDSPHGAHYEVAYEIWKDNQLFGVGLKKFRIVCDDVKYNNLKSVLKKQRCSSHPHNTYLELLSETGVLGLILFLVFIYNIFTKYLRGLNLNNDIIVLMLILTIFLRIWPIIPTGSFFTNSSLVHFWLTLGLLNYFHVNKKNIKLQI